MCLSLIACLEASSPSQRTIRFRFAVALALIALFGVSLQVRAVTEAECIADNKCANRIVDLSPDYLGFTDRVDGAGWVYGICRRHSFSCTHPLAQVPPSGPDPDSIISEYEASIESKSRCKCPVRSELTQDWRTGGPQPNPCTSNNKRPIPRFGAEIEIENVQSYAVHANCGNGEFSSGWFQLVRRRRVTCPPGTLERKIPGGVVKGCVLQAEAPLRNTGPCKAPMCPAIGIAKMAGNPINAATGNKYQHEVDYTGAVAHALRFERHYNSNGAVVGGALGPQWRHTYERVLLHQGATVMVYHEDGSGILYTQSAAGVWRSRAGTINRLTESTDAAGVRTGWEYRRANDSVESYDLGGRLTRIMARGGLTQTLTYSDGRLDAVTGPFGRTLTFEYDGARLARMLDPAGNEFRFEYEDGVLVRVIYPDGTPDDPSDDPVRQYHYENAAFPHHLTGITDERGERFATWDYDGLGRGVSSSHGGALEANLTTLTYNADGTTTVTDPLGSQRTVGFQLSNGTYQPVSVAGERCADCGGKWQSVSLDENGFPERSVSFEGHVTLYSFDDRGLERSRTEALGTPQERTITRTWHDEYRVPVSISRPGQRVTFTYDGAGNRLTRTVTDTEKGRSRTTTNTWNAEALLESTDGPRTDVPDVTWFSYESGVPVRVENALGHVHQTTAYDAHGQALRVMDPNDLRTAFDYDERNRLIERTVDGNRTRLVRDGIGNVVHVMQPDGVSFAYEFDAAGRLTAISDGGGQRVEYELDAAGNREVTRIRGAEGEVTWRQTQTFDSRGRLSTRTSGEGQVESFDYDDNDNLRLVVNGLGHRTVNEYDALDRLERTVDARGGVTTFGYDARDNLTAVTDPRGLTTTYQYDGLDNLQSEVSPDAGSRRYTTDDAGNRLTATDARGIEVRFTYDTLNRLRAIRYPDPAENVFYTYDTAENGIGQVAVVNDHAGETRMAYDIRGNLEAERRTILGVTYDVSYEYDDVDRVSAITYPSGAMVRYHRDDLGRVSAVTSTRDGVTSTLATDIEYDPFGAVRTKTFGNGLVEEMEFDLAGRLERLTTMRVLARLNVYDDGNNIQRIDDFLNPRDSQVFSYDELDRLTSATGAYGTLDYAYDPTGNRTSRLGPDGADFFDIDPHSNRLLSVTGSTLMAFAYDDAGNTIQRGEQTLGYNKAGRLETVADGGVERARYIYNALGERSHRQTDDGDTRFVFGQSGELLVEDGDQRREYVYLEGRLLARLDGGGGGATPNLSSVMRFEGGGNVVEFDVDRNQVTLAFADGVVRQHPSLLSAAWRERAQSGMRWIPTGFRISGRENVRGRMEVSGGSPTRLRMLTTVYFGQNDVYAVSAPVGQWTLVGTSRGSSATGLVSIDVETRTVTVHPDGGDPIEYVVPESSWVYTESLDAPSLRFHARGAAGGVNGSLRTHGGVLRGSIYFDEGRRRELLDLTYVSSGESGPVTRYFHLDHLDTPLAMTGTDSEVAWQGGYLPFGSTHGVAGVVAQDVRFPGQFVDRGARLRYNYQRYYDPGTGRYLRSDPIGLDGGINTYGYALQNPVRHMDPEGLNPVLIQVAIRVGQWGLKVLRNRKLSRSEAKRRLRRGEDVVTSRKQAKKLQKQKGKGRPIRERHGEGTQHTHRGDRQGGHAFSPDKLKVLMVPGAAGGSAVTDEIFAEFCLQNPFAEVCNPDHCQ